MRKIMRAHNRIIQPSLVYSMINFVVAEYFNAADEDSGSGCTFGKFFTCVW